jgi:hypothetical protein
MVRIAKILRGCFGFMALACGFALLLALRNFSQLFHPYSNQHLLHRHNLAWTLLDFHILVLAQAIVFPIVYAMAWLQTGKGSGRGWAIAASLINTLFGALMLLTGLRLIPAVLLISGIAGLVVYVRPNVLPQAAAQTVRQTPISNRPIHRFLAFLARWALLPVAFWCWHLWRTISHLPAPSFGTILLWTALAGFITTIVHECGHAVGGMALGMKLHLFCVGPFQWQKRRDRWRFRFETKEILGAVVAGRTGLIPTNLKMLLPNELCMIAGGPFANLCLGLLVFCAALTASAHSWAWAADLLALVAMISVLSGIANLIPVRAGQYYSDGAHIYNLLTGGPELDLLRAHSGATITLVTPRRPRDYDIQAIRRATLSFSEGHHAMLLRIWLSAHFLDRQQIPEAIQAMLEAEAIGEVCYKTFPGELLATFVFDHALLREDAARARLWWDRMEARQSDPESIDREWARTALFWIEGRHQEAREALRRGENQAAQLPDFGAYDFDRYHFQLLRQAMDAGRPEGLAPKLSPASTARPETIPLPAAPTG